MINTIAKMLNTSRQSYYNWKDNKPVISFLEKYFQEQELEEYLITNKIAKLELIKDITYEDLKDIISKKSNVNEVEKGSFDFRFKIKEINIREKAILYHTIQTFKPYDKDSLLNSIKSLKLTEVLYKQTIDSFIKIFKKSDSKYDNKLGFSFDKINLINYIEKYISDEEIISWLKEPVID